MQSLKHLFVKGSIWGIIALSWGVMFGCSISLTSFAGLMLLLGANATTLLVASSLFIGFLTLPGVALIMRLQGKWASINSSRDFCVVILTTTIITAFLPLLTICYVLVTILLRIHRARQLIDYVDAQLGLAHLSAH